MDIAQEYQNILWLDYTTRENICDLECRYTIIVDDVKEHLNHIYNIANKDVPNRPINYWAQILNMERKRKDMRAFMDTISASLKRGFAYLIKPRKDDAETWLRLSSSYKAIAMTLSLQKQYQDELEDDKLRDLLKDALDFFEMNYFFYPDIDSGGNRHYHGIILADLHKFATFRRYFNKHIGWVKKEYLKDPEGWLKYMRKDKGFTSAEHPNPLREPIYTDEEKYRLALIRDEPLYMQ